MSFKIPNAVPKAAPIVSHQHHSIFFDDDDFFAKHAPSLSEERTSISNRNGNTDIEEVVVGFNANDFIESQLGSDDSIDPELSCMNMALANTEAFADLDSPIRPRKSLSMKKRKSTHLGTPDSSAFVLAKRRTIFKTPIPATAHSILEQDLDEDFFKSQFLKQVDSLNSVGRPTQHTSAMVFENIGLSQFFQATQLEMPVNLTVATPAPLRMTQMLNDDIGFLDQVEDLSDPLTDSNARISILAPSTSSGFTQMLHDDADGLIDQLDIPIPPPIVPIARTSSFISQLLSDDLFIDELPPQSSQRFLHDVREVEVVPPNNPPAITDPVTVYTSATSEAAYIERQREMHSLNEVNLDDDNFLDPELSQAYKSTQYRRELEAVFKQCETTICVSKDGVDAGLEDMNWTQNDFIVKIPARENIATQRPAVKSTRTPLISPTNLVRQRLEDRRKLISPPEVVKKDVNTGSFHSLGPFFGLPLKVKYLIKDFKGISELYDWQRECLTLPAIARRDNLIYALPTSGGKTLVSEILILREVLCRRKNCLFILPYVSIVQEKLWALSPFAVQLDFLLEEYASGKGMLPPQKRRKKRSIYIATIEKGLALLNSLIETNRANELGMIVVDELHIIGEQGRGATLEALLTKAIFISAGIQIIGMSATIGNLPELAKFLRADVYTRDFRPVELREYIKCGKDIMQIHTSKAATGNLAETFEHVRSVEFNYREDVERRDPDHLAGLVSEVIPEQSVLVFCPSKANCENVAKLLSKLLPAKFRDYKATQRAELKQFMEKDGPLCSILSSTLPFGVAYHHSGLTGEERRHLEDAFRMNIICVICCTSTLAAGVNLPAKRVILRSPYVGREFITLSRYKQMVGRAGRAGLCGDVGESILICSPKDNVRVGQLLCSPMDEAASGLHEQGGKGVESMILSGVGLGMAANRTEIVNLMNTTLMGVQSERLGVDTEKLTNQVLTKLFRQKTLSIKDEDLAAKALSSTVSLDMSTQSRHGESQEASTSDGKRRPKTSVRLKPSTTMQISSMGRASFKSGFDLAKANIVYNDLVHAQQSLVISTYLHLLYVVTPYEPADVSVTPDNTQYYAQYLKLDKNQLQVAKVLGITESVALRIRSGKAIKTPELARVVNRFFFTLILQELWNQRTVYEVADMFRVNRGVVQTLITASASFASGVLKFCEELDEFWAFKELLRLLTKRLSYCCTQELVPLMDLPCVKLARAKQLYAAGFKTLESIAKADIGRLVNAIEHLNTRVAKQLVSSAKVLLLEKVETLREEVQDCLEVLEGN